MKQYPIHRLRDCDICMRRFNHGLALLIAVAILTTVIVAMAS